MSNSENSVRLNSPVGKKAVRYLVKMHADWQFAVYYDDELVFVFQYYRNAFEIAQLMNQDESRI